MSVESVSLFYCAGGSDKEYHAQLEQQGSGFVVNFAFGRRGSTLQTGTKTAAPVPLEKAKAIYDKLVKEKLAKGYSPGPDGTPYQHTAKEERTTGVLPQLLNPIEEDEAQSLIKDSRFWAQEKKDGKRVLVRKTGSEVTGINRKGLSIGLPQPIVEAAKSLPGSFIIDGECCGDVLFAFDLLELDENNLRSLAYSERLATLTALLPKNGGKAIQLLETARTEAGKRELYDRLKREKREGIVFKQQDALYVAGRPNSGGTHLKCKFCASASCIVSRRNGKRSVGLELLDDDGERVGVGNVTIPPNHPVPPENAVVEARYLYAIPGGALFQPVFLGQRDDIDANACKLSQLKFKRGDDDEA